MIRKLAPKYDLVIVVDFGHSMMTQEAISALAGSAFLAVNAQANAGNMGYNVISKYPRADYITMAEGDAARARDHRGDLRPMIKDVAAHEVRAGRRRLRAQRSLVYDRKKGYSVIPALAGVVVDRVGAGDVSVDLRALRGAGRADGDRGVRGQRRGRVGGLDGLQRKAVDRIGLCCRLKPC